MAKKNTQEAVLVGLQFIINKDGNIVADISGIPPEEIGNVFKKNKDLRYTVALLVSEARAMFRDNVESIERILNEMRKS
jgi:hypothetical protein